MIFDVSHRTHYVYSQPVVQSQHLIHMSPRPCLLQEVHHHSLIVDPAPALRNNGTDAFGNPVVLLDIEVPHRELILHARSTIKVTPPAPVEPSHSTPWNLLDTHILETGRSLDLDVLQYRCASRLTTPNLEIEDYAARSLRPGRPLLEGVIELNQRIFDDFTFDPTATDISTPISQVVKQRRGVCQDFAHLMLAGLRAMRIPARYVSGYILTRPPPGHPRLQGADASHAWVSVWSPEIGWTDLDPTNGLIVADEHITIAHGRDYDDVSPICGVILGGGEHTVSVGVDVVQS
jgi:transglutaminase-like putative cysteine protease